MKNKSRVLNGVFAVIIVLLAVYIIQLRKTNEFKQKQIDECLYAWADYIDSTQKFVNIYKDSLELCKNSK